jgi:hypothetical protein
LKKNDASFCTFWEANMPLACRACSRVNPDTARYCHHDGAALEGNGQAGPIAVGARPFLAPFVFPSGKKCSTFNELILACELGWEEAREMLSRGFFEAFLAGLGRADLATAARRSVEQSDSERGLDALLAELPGDRRPPLLVLGPREINLGQVKRGEDRSLTIRLENAGMGLLSGSIQSEVPWLTLGDLPWVLGKVFQVRHDLTVAVEVAGKALRSHPRVQEGRIVVTSNGGTTAVVVRVEVPPIPFPDGVLSGARTPRQLAEKARVEAREAVRLFESGAVAQWYEANGWKYPVPGPAAGGVASVQQFFEALGLSKPPPVILNQTSVELAGAPGGNVEAFVFVESPEARAIYAHAVSEAPWLQIGKSRSQGNAVRIHLRVPSVPSLPGQTLKGRATIISNGNQRFKVDVALKVLSPVVPMVPPAPVAAPAKPKPVVAPPPPPKAPAVPAEGKPAKAPELPAPVLDPAQGLSAWASQLEGLLDQEGIEVAPKKRRRTPQERPLEAAEKDEKAFVWEMGFVWHLLPLLAVLLVLAGLLLHDLRLPSRPFASDEDERARQTLVDAAPLLELHFNDGPPDSPKSPYVGKTMMFGLSVRNPARPGGKRLLYERLGRTNNTCVRIDGCDYLFGHDNVFAPSPGQRIEERAGVSRWIELRSPLGDDASGRQREGAKSIWEVVGPRDRPCRVQVTQLVEIIPGPQSGRLDTCLIRYTLHNLDPVPHDVGIRFLLDTYIGENDGVPFTIPGKPGLCSTKQSFDSPGEVPDYIEALEKDSLLSPGTVAHLQFRVPGSLEPPSRVLLGGYPDAPLRDLPDLGYQLANSWLTPWEVPFVRIRELVERQGELKPKGRKQLPDSAVTIFWNVRTLEPAQRRQVGFTYGLGSFASAESEGKLLLTLGGRTVRDGEFTLTALRSSPLVAEKLTLVLPEGDPFELLTPAEQEVPAVVEGSSRPISTVTWRLRARGTGRWTLVVRSTAGVSQNQAVRIIAPPPGVLD